VEDDVFRKTSNINHTKSEKDSITEECEFEQLKQQ
jgi:hypothetical protein